ncbi:hypothetical protein AAGV28_08175 [Flavobacterium sp. FZUC8N2.13]|uniref:HEAT repeat domain-containing protein n=1 Tax=Flavobacterium zubiriense TaxID=3138075 RepID=A0ABV4TBL8_9FLAO
MFELLQNSIVALYNSHPIIQFCIDLSLLFIAIIVLLLIYLKNLRNRLRLKGRIEATYQKKYESDLIEYLYAGNEDDTNITVQQQKIVVYLKKCAENRLKRKLIIATFLKLKNEISGETADAIQNLYYQTGLINSATSKLKSKKWDSVARAIRELTQFEIKEAHDAIILLVNHPRKEVRNEIQKYLVKLFRFDGLKFLNVLENPLSAWDQIQLLEILNKFTNLEIPEMNNWLQSKNNSVISFTLKLAKIYNQFGVKDEVIALFNHPNIDIRIEAIEVVTHLGIYEATAILKEDYFTRTLEEQIAFFKMMEDMAMPEDIPFIKEHIQHENFFIRISVMKILNLIIVDEDNTFRINTITPDYSIDNDLTIAS